MSTKIRPMGNRVAVRRLEAELKTAGGIVIPDSATEKPIQGEIVAMGPGKTLDNGDVRAIDVKVGDVVLFGKYAGTEVKLGGEDLVIMNEDDLLGVIVK
jgi:chaperonin GroES